jgi:hypothetical protein
MPADSPQRSGAAGRWGSRRRTVPGAPPTYLWARSVPSVPVSTAPSSRRLISVAAYGRTTGSGSAPRCAAIAVGTSAVDTGAPDGEAQVAGGGTLARPAGADPPASGARSQSKSLRRLDQPPPRDELRAVRRRHRRTAPSVTERSRRPPSPRCSFRRGAATRSALAKSLLPVRGSHRPGRRRLHAGSTGTDPQQAAPTTAPPRERARLT